MTRVVEIVPHAEAIQAHVLQVVENPAFKGSRRSRQFLQYVVDNALEGRFDELKERTLGAKLFGREPGYDTADDAIVRVTACDVRRRLVQYYAETGAAAEFRIELPPGSYIPEFRRVAARLPELAPEPAQIPYPEPVQELAPDPPAQPKPPISTTWRWLAATAAALTLLVALALWANRRADAAKALPDRVLPWSALLQPGRQVHVIFCDPEIVNIQHVSGVTVTLPDYANQHYLPTSPILKPEQTRLLQSMGSRGVSVAAVDARIGVGIATLLASNGSRALNTHTARSLRLGDFKSEDSFVLFGSPRSNPWVELFQSQLDFRFEFDPGRKAEFIRNQRPAPGEAAAYVPTAEGWQTGHAYGIIALVSNPNQSGHVLLLAGSNAEATEAAGKLASDLPLLSRTLKDRGIDPNGPSRNFEILLRVSTMAGSSNTFEVIALHALSSKPS